MPKKCVLCEEEGTVYRSSTGICYLCARACEGHLDGIIHLLENVDAVSHNIKKMGDDFRSLLASALGVSPYGVGIQKEEGGDNQERVPGVRQDSILAEGS